MSEVLQEGHHRLELVVRRPGSLFLSVSQEHGELEQVRSVDLAQRFVQAGLKEVAEGDPVRGEGLRLASGLNLGKILVNRCVQHQDGNRVLYRGGLSGRSLIPGEDQAPAGFSPRSPLRCCSL